MLHFVNLRCIVCYFDTFIHCNMTGTKAIFIPVHHHSTIVVSTFITLCIQSLFFIYFSLQVCTLKHHESYPLTIHSLVTTILLLFFFKNKLDFLRFHMLCDIVPHYHTCLSLKLSHSAQGAQGPSILSEMAKYPFSWLNNTTLHCAHVPYQRPTFRLKSSNSLKLNDFSEQGPFCC